MRENRRKHQTLKEMPGDEKPREKLFTQGVSKLSNTELLALILRTGSKGETALGLSQRLLGHLEGLKGLMDFAVEELMELEGIGPAKAAQLKAVSELSKRMPGVKDKEISIKSPNDAACVLMNSLRYLKQEVFKVILLNTKNKIIAVEDVSQGSLNSSIVHPREVFNIAIRRSSAAVILVHNHPSGDPNPSQDDIRVTKRLIEVGHLVGIVVLDHIIIGDGIYVSLKEQGHIKQAR